jgi:hypothetical protein
MAELQRGVWGVRPFFAPFAFALTTLLACSPSPSEAQDPSTAPSCATRTATTSKRFATLQRSALAESADSSQRGGSEQLLHAGIEFGREGQ